MRKLFGMGTARGLQAATLALSLAYLTWFLLRAVCNAHDKTIQRTRPTTHANPNTHLRRIKHANFNGQLTTWISCRGRLEDLHAVGNQVGGPGSFIRWFAAVYPATYSFGIHWISVLPSE